MQKGNLDLVIKNRIEVIIIDALNLVHRYNWSMRNLKDSKGRDTGIFYGILNFYCGLKMKYGEQVRIIFLWDRNSNKKKISKEYKANRKTAEDSFIQKVKELENLLSYLDVEQYYKEGMEADDLAYYFAKQYKERNVLFISKDNDWLINIINDKKLIQIEDKVYCKSEIEESLGMDIKYYPLFKAIIGDACDNIHGIFRAKQTENKKTIKELISILEEIKGDLLFIDNLRFSNGTSLLKNFIIDNIDKIRENYELVKFQELNGEMNSIRRKKNKKEFFKKLESYEMKHLIEKIKKYV